MCVPGCNKTTETTVTLITQQLMKHVGSQTQRAAAQIPSNICFFFFVTPAFFLGQKILCYIEIHLHFPWLFFSVNNVNYNYENIPIKVFFDLLFCIVFKSALDNF